MGGLLIHGMLYRAEFRISSNAIAADDKGCTSYREHYPPPMSEV